jgi:glucose-6-phosphate 1-dehydrogenase
MRELFTRMTWWIRGGASVDAPWSIVDPVLDNVAPLHTYGRGTWGPAEAAELIGADGPWRDPYPRKAR